MSSIPRNLENENDVLDFVTSFFKEFHISKRYQRFNENTDF